MPSVWPGGQQLPSGCVDLSGLHHSSAGIFFLEALFVISEVLFDHVIFTVLVQSHENDVSSFVTCCFSITQLPEF